LAEALDESELAILAAFRALQDEGIVTPHFGLYCGQEHLPIDVFDSLDEVPEQSECFHCGREHRLEERSMYVEVFFTVDHQKLDGRQRRAA
jgi:hypothetical protein